MEVRNQINWARKETNLLLKDIQKRTEQQDCSSTPDLTQEQANKLTDMADTALKAYEMMFAKAKELDSYAMLQAGRSIVDRLFKQLPLTEITEADFEEAGKDGIAHCTRADRLIKFTNEETTVYIDQGRFMDIRVEEDKPIFNSLVEAIAQEGFPIELPYTPTGKTIAIFYSEDAFDTDHVIGVTHFLPEGQLNPRPIGRYFKEVACDECDYNMPDGKFVEIDKEKFLALKIRIEKARKEAEEKGEN